MTNETVFLLVIITIIISQNILLLVRIRRLECNQFEQFKDIEILKVRK